MIIDEPQSVLGVDKKNKTRKYSHVQAALYPSV